MGASFAVLDKLGVAYEVEAVIAKDATLQDKLQKN